MRHIPNALTILRMLVIPVFAYLMFTHASGDAGWIILWLFVGASLTDWLDGYLARKMNVISDFGKIMDPLADKLLVLTALAGLTWLPPYRLPMAIFFIILIREVAITILREINKKRGIIMPADKLGKLKTVMQMLGITAALALSASIVNLSRSVIISVQSWFWLVAAITLYSGINYIFNKPKGGKR